MKLSNYIAEFIAAKGTRHVFTVTGGAIAHVVDAIGRRMEREQDISYVCVEHEQAGAMAAEAYSRLGPGPGVAIATSGPGATNLITGICGLYFDSLPGVFITGQVNTKESVESTQSKPRQVGFQETDIVRIVTPVTKYAVQVRDPSRIRYELEKAYYIAHERRQGPVLLDVPLDVQVAEIETEKLERFKPQESDALPEEEIRANVRETLALLKAAARPVILLGGGVKLAHAQALAKETVEALGIPAVVSWSGFDILPHDHPQFAGAIGVYGNRGANFTIQNSDFLLSVGSRLDTRQTGGRVDWFAREAKSVMVDIDESELHKRRGFAPTVAVRADAKAFLHALLQEIRRDEVLARHDWLARAIAWRRKYPAVLPEYYTQPSISSYVFVRALSDAVGPNEIVITNEGGNLVWTMQAWEVKEGQRVISTFGNSPMGYAFPAAIGAAFARPGKQIICIDGDGGFQPNIQELQTVAHYKLPLKIFILNNRSMGIIKQFQDAYFGGRYHASAPEGDYTMPDFQAIARAYGIDAMTVDKQEGMQKAIQSALAHEGPILVNVLIDTAQKLNPKLEFGRPLEDMCPYLSDEEFYANLLVKPVPRMKEQRGWQQAE